MVKILLQICIILMGIYAGLIKIVEMEKKVFKISNTKMILLHLA